MNLKDYLYIKKITQADFAWTIGINPLTLQRIMKGQVDIKLSIALKIQKETNGNVTCDDLLKLNKKSSHYCSNSAYHQKKEKRRITKNNNL